MAYLKQELLDSMGFLSLGRDVLISDKASLYDTDKISIGDRTRIDDFCVLAGRISIGSNVHLTVFCNVAGGNEGVEIGDFSTLAYGCHIVAQTDDYTGETMTNSTLPLEFRMEIAQRVVVGRHSILGTGCIVLPGVELAEGTSAGAGTVFTQSTSPWTMYVGTPARELRPRSRRALELERKYLERLGE